MRSYSWRSFCVWLLLLNIMLVRVLPWWLRWLRICLQCRRPGSDPWVGKISWRRACQPTPIFLPGEFCGQKSPMGYSPWGHKESDKTELLTLSFLLRETHKPVFTWQRQGKTSLKETYPMWLVFVSCVFSLWYANILQLVLYFCSRYEVQPSTLLSRLCLCQQLQPP